MRERYLCVITSDFSFDVVHYSAERYLHLLIYSFLFSKKLFLICHWFTAWIGRKCAYRIINWINITVCGNIKLVCRQPIPKMLSFCKVQFEVLDNTQPEDDSFPSIRLRPPFAAGNLRLLVTSFARILTIRLPLFSCRCSCLCHDSTDFLTVAIANFTRTQSRWM